MHPRERKETGVVLMKGAAKYQGPPPPIQPEKTARFWLVLAIVFVVVFFGTKVLHCQTRTVGEFKEGVSDGIVWRCYWDGVVWQCIDKNHKWTESAPKPKPTPDAPSYATRPHVAGECGPKWMGGCWTFDRPQLTWGEAARSKKFWIPTTVFTLSAGWDYATTAYFSRYGHYLGDPKNSPCMERNQDLGQRPGAGDFAKNFATTHLPVIALGLVATKLKVPHWIYDGAVVYGTQVHVRGAIGWYRDCW